MKKIKKLSVSNNNYVLKIGDLVKIIKKIEYVGGRTININSLYFIKDVWSTTNGNIVLKSDNPKKYDFSLDPSYVDKVLNYKQTKQKKEAAWKTKKQKLFYHYL